MAAPKIHLIIIDDHLSVSNALALLFRKEKEIVIDKVCCYGPGLINMIRNYTGAIILLDISTSLTKGFPTQIEILKKYPSASIIAISTLCTGAYKAKFKALGGKGYICKDFSFEEMMTVINAVSLQGEYWGK